MIRGAMVRQSSPGESSPGNVQHNLKDSFTLLSVDLQQRGKMVLVQFLDGFEHGDELWVILESQPARIDIGDWRVNYDRSLRRIH